jgi:NAD-dependent dihydropyrimidine dehydrogenase PreA subunit
MKPTTGTTPGSIKENKEIVMAQIKINALPNITTPNTPVIFNPEICNGCNQCVEVCQIDVFIPNPNKGEPPIILHPDECWYGGCCVNDCPRPGAISFNWPIQQRGSWRDKVTGKVMRDTE